MPAFLIKKLKREYGENSKIPYMVANKLGAMMGSKTTALGRRWQKKHDRDVKAGKAKD